jgi:hypothetical protein
MATKKLTLADVRAAAKPMRVRVRLSTTQRQTSLDGYEALVLPSKYAQRDLRSALSLLKNVPVPARRRVCGEAQPRKLPVLHGIDCQGNIVPAIPLTTAQRAKVLSLDADVAVVVEAPAPSRFTVEDAIRSGMAKLSGVLGDSTYNLRVSLRENHYSVRSETRWTAALLTADNAVVGHANGSDCLLALIELFNLPKVNPPRSTETP